MIELVGKCNCCERAIYCRDGFLDGEKLGKNGELCCFPCLENMENENKE
ncbi:hypothetical protein [Bacillus sp. M6-12]|nr:hypothetical protein [Bacillus sp. M6-12]